MSNKKLSLMQTCRSQIKNELDGVLDSDYNLLRSSNNQADDILRCEIVHKTPLIKKYIEELEQEYNIPSPLKHSKEVSLSKSKQQEISNRNAALKKDMYLKNSKPRQRLTLVSNQKPSCQSLISQLEKPLCVSQKETPLEKYSLNTPKFGLDAKLSAQVPSEGIISSEQVVRTVRDNIMSRGSQRINFIYSKEKPKLKSPSNIVFSYADSYPFTAKKQSSSSRSEGRSNELSLSFSYRDTPEKRTIKKEAQEFRLESESSVGQFNSRYTILHKNPAADKRMSRSKMQSPKLHILESFRYCVGCQQAILSVNIKHHQTTCEAFQELNNLSNEQLLQRLRDKVAKLEEKIPRSSQQVNSEQVFQLRSHSNDLVDESKKRARGSPESPRFRQNYDSVVKIGNKWCSALEQINKLRWFTRILYKLESMAQEYAQ